MNLSDFCLRTIFEGLVSTCDCILLLYFNLIGLILASHFQTHLTQRCIILVRRRLREGCAKLHLFVLGSLYIDHQQAKSFLQVWELLTIGYACPTGNCNLPIELEKSFFRVGKIIFTNRLWLRRSPIAEYDN